MPIPWADKTFREALGWLWGFLIRFATALFSALSVLGKVLLCILLAGLGWLAQLLTNRFPFVCLVLFDGSEKRSTLFTIEFSVVHVLIPMLFDAPLRPVRERFCDFAPAFALVSHTF